MSKGRIEPNSAENSSADESGTLPARMVKRKRTVLSLSDKLVILDSLEKGEVASAVAKKFRVADSTITGIKKQSEAIRFYAASIADQCDERALEERFLLSKPYNLALDRALHTWFLQRRELGLPVTGPLLCEKAREFNESTGGSPNFVASSGWLEKFKSRHGIKRFGTKKGYLSEDHQAAEQFVKEFVGASVDHDLDFVYNADETGILWRSLPTRSLVDQREAGSEDRVAVMLCANATGTHSLPLLLIGKAEKPHCFGNVQLPLVYYHHKKAWMDSALFVNWYDDVFIPNVKDFQQRIGKEGKVKLVINNAPTFPRERDLIREDGLFTVEFLPPRVAAIVQPMDQGVKETFKRRYRKRFLQRLLFEDSKDVEALLRSFREYNLKDCCYMLAESWESMHESTLISAWNKILQRKVVRFPRFDEDSRFITRAIKIIAICNDCTDENITEWMNRDANERGFRVLSDGEILEEVKALREEENNVSDSELDSNLDENASKTGSNSDERTTNTESNLNESTIKIESNLDETTIKIENSLNEPISEIESDLDEATNLPSNEEALQAADVLVKWLERRKDCGEDYLLKAYQIRNLVASETISTETL